MYHLGRAPSVYGLLNVQSIYVCAPSMWVYKTLKCSHQCRSIQNPTQIVHSAFSLVVLRTS